MLKRGRLYVVLQFCCIVILLLNNGLPIYAWQLIIQVIAVSLGLWAIYEANKSALSIFPEVRSNAYLVESGPYHKIRHPMYSSILLFFLPVLFSFSVINGIVYGILLITLISKLNYEEVLLQAQFKNYSNYQQRTYRLIPFLY